MNLPASPLPALQVVDLVPDGERQLQAFFEANPLYFVQVNGVPAQPGEAHDEIHGALPAGWPFTQKYVFGYQEQTGQLRAMVNVVSDLLRLLYQLLHDIIVAKSRHGTGDAHVLYESVERWAQQGGARWMRLGVVRGNARAEAFWVRFGYQQVAVRPGIVMGEKMNAIRVMAKALFGQPVSDYHALVARDRPPSA